MDLRRKWWNSQRANHATGEIHYQPQDTGSLDLKVRLLDGGNMEQANFELTQDIVSLNPILEGVIASAGDQPGPGVGNPDMVRELVNDYSIYYQGVTLQTAEPAILF